MFPLSTNPHNLIDQTPTFSCDKHLVSVHSNDRDVSKWPTASQFEITLPREMRNVETVRLSEISLPATHNAFSVAKQNVRMRFHMDGVTNTITIQDGNYTPTQLAREIENRMNVMVYGSDTHRFHVTYDDVGQKMVFGNDRDMFSLTFDSMDGLYEEVRIGERYADWGLGACLGFDKETYEATHITTDPHFYHLEGSTRWFAVDAGGGGYTVTAPYPTNCHGDDVVYMEVDRLNSMDELVPYSDTSINTGYSVRHNQHAMVTHVAGRPNSCFAKIPVNDNTNDSKNRNLSNITQYNPPIERIERMKFRFRTHNGELIDFGNRSVHFSLEFHCIRNEMRRGDSVRKPSVW